MGTDTDSILDGLDESQRLAATTFGGPVRIVAGAGSGKTRTVTRRIAYGCATGQMDQSRVLAVTFSVKAASEMRGRLQTLGVGDSVRSATFHSEALRQLRMVWSDISEAPFPQIAANVEPIISQALQRFDNSERFGLSDIHGLIDEINWAKVNLVAPDDYPKLCAVSHRLPPAGIEPQRFAEMYTAYEAEKSAKGVMDFNDILLMVCHVLTDFPEAAASIRTSIGWLTVDEYQDVSPLQHRLMKLWLDGNRNVCVVGDPAQTIYSFAGASSYDLLHFSEEFAPLAADVGLDTDYRSTAQIVGVANAVLSRSPVRCDYLKLSASGKTGPRVTRTVYEDDEEEAVAVAKGISNLVRAGADISDCAVLMRVNAQASLICRALKAEGLDYRLRRDSGAGQSATVLEEENGSRRNALESLGLRAAGAVNVSTIHASKGLEFGHVFLIGCSEGLLPYGSPAPGDELEEERRLMYVAITRAEETLHVSYARTKEGSGAFHRSPSRFL